MLGLASCQNDFDGANVGVGGEVDFQLAVAAPEFGATRAAENGTSDTKAGANSAYGAIDYLQGTEDYDPYKVDWKDVDLRYSLEVYDYDENGNYTAAPVKDRMVQIVDEYKPVVFDLRLVPGRKYHFVVFADFLYATESDNTYLMSNGDTITAPTTSIADQQYLGFYHEIGATLRDITIVNDAINSECTDAYFATDDFTISNSAANNIELKRPYGKLRVVATDLAELNLNVNPQRIQVDYTTEIPTTFNAVTGAVDTRTANKTYVAVLNVTKEDMSRHLYTEGYDSKTTTNANGDTRYTHVTLFTDYVLAEKVGQTPHHFTMTVFDDRAGQNPIKTTTFSTDIPVQRNHLTTVIGNVLTTGTEINVTINDNFDGEEVIEAITVKDQKGFIDALATAANQEYAVIELTNDIEWTTGAEIGSTPLIGADAVTKNLVIYGNGSKLIAKGSGVGSIRMANGGTLTLNDVVVVDESVSYAESSWEYGYLEFAGKIVFNNCVFENAIMVEKEDNKESNVCFNTCAFNSNDAQQYDVWVADGLVFFNDCDIEGYRGIKMHEAYGSEVVEVVIDGCRFTNLSKKPGVAMGDLNADTKVVIKNSTFTNCQAGDQGLYIYETDTDITTFTFTEQNNTVVMTSNEALEEALENGLEEVAVAAGEYTFPSAKIQAGQTIVCEEGTVFTGNSKLNIKGATVIGATFSNPSGSAVDQTINGTFKECTFTGSNALRWCYAGDTCVFENCDFSGNVYGIHFDGGDNKEVTFRNCTISGFNGLGSAISMVTFEGCTFVGNGKSGYNGANLWGSAKLINCEFTFNGTTSNEWIDCIGTDKTYEITNCTINGVPYTVDNHDIYPQIFSRNNATVKINGVGFVL